MPTSKLYIESPVFIDMAKHYAKVSLSNDEEHNVWFCNQLLLAAQAEKVEIFTSSITIAECTHVGGTLNDDVKRFFMGLLASGKSGVKLVQPTMTIMEKARSLRWDSGISLAGIDSIHVASALNMQCEEILTKDGKILASEKLSVLGVRAIRPRDTQLLPAEFRQGQLSESAKSLP